MNELTTITVTQSMPIPYEYPDESYGSITYEVKASYILKTHEYDPESDKDAEWFIRGTVESAVSMAIINASGTPISELPRVLVGIEEEIGKLTRYFCDFKSVELVNIVSVKKSA